MGIDTAHYHGWHGRLHSPWRASLALVRVALVQLFRRKLYWVVLGLGLTRFVLYWSVIFALTQIGLPPQAQERLLERTGFSAQADETQQNGYVHFMEGQAVVVMILLALSGSLLVGADFRHRSLPFYLSRRIDRRHYIAGKLLAVSAIVALLTVAPALLLFVEYGMFTSSFEYWVSNWRMPLAVLTYGLVLCGVLSVLLVTLSAYLERLAPIAATWCSLFALLGYLGPRLRKDTGNANWLLVDLWRNMRDVAQLAFGTFKSEADAERAWWALAVLAAITALALAALVRRVRAVDVVT